MNSTIENDTYHTPNGIISQLNVFESKQVLVGDYSIASYFNTKIVLESLGFLVDIVPTIEEIEQKIINKEKYDVIFTNNIYRSGTGTELLAKLKKVKGFNIPIILHSIDNTLQESYKSLGFSGFLLKPIKQQDTISLLNKVLS